MSVSVLWELDDVTTDQYDAVRAELETRGMSYEDVPGLIYHSVGFVDGVLTGSELWVSNEYFEEFVMGTLMPAFEQFGISPQPRVKVIPVHRSYP